MSCPFWFGKRDLSEASLYPLLFFSKHHLVQSKHFVHVCPMSDYMGRCVSASSGNDRHQASVQSDKVDLPYLPPSGESKWGCWRGQGSGRNCRSGAQTGEVALSSSRSSARSVWAFSQTWPVAAVVDFQKTRAECSKASSQKMAQVPTELPVPGVREPVLSELGFHGPPSADT